MAAPYADPLELSMALVRAAQATGIGLTLLPTLYMRSGFGAARPCAMTSAALPAHPTACCGSVKPSTGCLPHINAGVALHSLRAVDPAALAEVAQATQGAWAWPVHIHIAEQVQEVNDCWPTMASDRLNGCWATWATLARRWTGAGTWFMRRTPSQRNCRPCAPPKGPSSSARVPKPIWATACLTCRAGWGPTGAWSIGSDSHVTRRLGEELRLLEYGQRLVRRQRNVAPRVAGPGAQDREGSTAAVLLQGALRGGGPATGLALGGLAVGQRADFSVIDAASDALAGIPWQRLLDAWVFSSPDAALQATHVAGRSVGGSPDDRLAWRAGMVGAMQALWSAPG
jgi:formimidoylglutamate deiminase